MIQLDRTVDNRGFVTKVVTLLRNKGANNPALITACRSVHQYELPDVLLALADPMYLAKGIAHIKDAVEHHAGELEISNTWYKHPHLIKEEKLVSEQVDLEPILSPFAHKDLFVGGGDSIEMFWNSQEQKAFAPTGAFTPSDKASPEKGKQYHEYMVKNLVKFIGWLRKYEGPIGNS